MNVSIIAGARPNFMKVAPLVGPFRERGMETRIVHTGQHYDQRMSETFFEELRIPHPDVNLGVGSGSHVWQIAEVMRRLEAEFTDHRPQALIVVGDVNSTLAAALTANKLEIPLAHVESGLRSFDRSMPEEHNRVLTDSISDWLFTSEPSAERNLRREGISKQRIFPVGNVMIDTLLVHLEHARSRRTYERFELTPRGYVLLTLHRPSNVDDPQRFEAILRAVHELCQHVPVLFPVHPRTTSRMKQFRFLERTDLNGYLPAEPLGYLDMLSLMDQARFVMTDSGGVQEETTALRVPCLTLRDNTERPVTLEIGSNRLVGGTTEEVLNAIDEVLAGPERAGTVPDQWDGKASLRIAEHLAHNLIE